MMFASCKTFAHDEETIFDFENQTDHYEEGEDGETLNVDRNSISKGNKSKENEEKNLQLQRPEQYTIVLA